MENKTPINIDAASRLLLVNPPVCVIDRVQLDFYADAQPFGLYQIATWLERGGSELRILDMMGYGKHSSGWESLIESGELSRIEELPTGAPGLKLQSYRYGRSQKWLSRQLDKLAEQGFIPEEIWVSCSMLFNAFLAKRTIATLSRHCPKAKIRLGGGYPSLSPEHAESCGAHQFYKGRIEPADRCLPDPRWISDDLGFSVFRLCVGCPNHCAFCINGHDKMVALPVEDVLDYIADVREKTGIRLFNNWDPNVLSFRKRFKSFLRSVIERDMDIELRFDMGLEPDRLDDETIAIIDKAPVSAFTLPIESSDPELTAFFNKPYSIVSSIRALDRLRNAGIDLSRCHATSIFGYPDEKLEELFTAWRISMHYDMLFTPFPILVLPHSPVFERYGSLLAGKSFREWNGHLFPLIRDRARLNLYRRLLLLMTSSKAAIEHSIERFEPWVIDAYRKSEHRADWLIEQSLLRPQEDTPDLLASIVQDFPCR